MVTYRIFKALARLKLTYDASFEETRSTNRNREVECPTCDCTCFNKENLTQEGEIKLAI